MTRSARASGFTLIELMVVVTIIGVLATIAIPEFTRLTLRSKQAERRYVMNTIKSGVADLFLQNGDLPSDPGTGQPYAVLVGPWTPALPAESLKRVPDWTQDDWNKIFQKRTGAGGTSGAPEIEGAVYFSYFYEVTRGTPTTLLVYSVGDLDGDGNQSQRYITYQRDAGGVFRMAGDWPVGWVDSGVDDGTF